MRKKSASNTSKSYYKDYVRKALFLFLSLMIFQYSSASAPAAVKDANESKSIEQSNITVKGTIKDETGEPLSGVSIVVKGTTTGTISDLDGAYTITAPNSNSTLVFSFIGFHTQQIVVGGKTSIDVVLVEDAKALEEVVVVGTVQCVNRM